MKRRRIESRASQTADITCLYRAYSFLEHHPLLHSDDSVAPLLLPEKIKPLARFAMARNFLSRLLGPKGMYEWVIARTKYIDRQFQEAGLQHYEQVLILGAGFDSRCVRFREQLKNTRIFEIDAATTQLLKITQFRKRDVVFPENVTFIPMNFETESMVEKLEKAGFQKGVKTLILMEGVLQYLAPKAANETLQNLQDLCGQGSRLICDYAHQSTLRGGGKDYGEKGVLSKIKVYGESWQFGLDNNEVQHFVEKYGFRLLDHKSPSDFEKDYFADSNGKVVFRVNGTQSIMIAEKQ